MIQRLARRVTSGEQTSTPQAQARRSHRYCADIDGRIMNNVCVFAVVELLVILVRLSFDVGLLCPTSMDILTLASLTPEMIQRQFENVR